MRGTVAAVGVAMALVVPASAGAQLVNEVVGAGGVDVVRVRVDSPPAEAVAGGGVQGLDAGSQLLCAPANQLNPQIGAVACAVGALDFRFMTKLRTNDGEVVRTRVGIVNVPTALEVGDGDATPDLIATVTATSLSRFGLRIERALGENGPLPVSVEALIDDPSAGNLPRENIAFGYDVRDDRAPQSWEAAITLADGERADDVAKLDVEHTTSGAGAGVTVTGGLYDGDDLQRRNPLGGRLAYRPAAPSANFGLTIGERLQLRLGASAPVTLTAEAELVDGPAAKRIRATLDQLPRSIVLDYEQTGENERVAAYTASASVPKVDVDYRLEEAGTLKQRAVVIAKQLPLGMRIEQTARLAGNFAATGGALGSVEVGFANGDPRLLAGADTPYAYAVTDGELKSYAGRVDELVSASFDATDAIELDTEFAARKPFVVKLDLPDMKVDGRLDELPRRASVNVNLTGGSIAYDGFGDTIDRIAVEATRTTPWFARATRVAGEVRALPPKVTIGFDIKAKEARFDASAPVGKIEFAGADGALESAPRGEAGIVLRDTPGRFAVAARVFGLQEARIWRDPASTDPDLMRLAAKIAPGPFGAVMEDATDLVEARVADLPGTLSATVSDQPANVVVTYDAGAPIAEVTASAVKKSGVFFDRVKRIEALVRGIPQKGTIFVGKRAKGVDFGADSAIALVEVKLSSGPEAPLPPDDHSGGIVEDLADRFTATLRMRGIRSASLAESGDVVIARARVARQPLRLVYKRPGLTVDALTSPIPDDITLQVDSKAGKARYQANAPIDRLDVNVLSDTQLFGRVKRIAAHLEGIPSVLDVTFKPQGGSGGGFDAPQSVDLLEVELTDGSPADRFGDGRSGVVVRDLPAKYSLFARLRELTGGAVLSSGNTVDVHVKTGEIVPGLRQSFDIDAQFDVAGDAINVPGTLTTSIPRLPGDIRVNHRPSATSWTASERIPRLEVKARDLPGTEVRGKVHHVDATVLGVPSRMDITHSSITNGVDVLNGEKIDRVDASLWDEGDPLPAPPEDGRNKAVLETRDGFMKVRLRVFNLNRAKLTDVFGLSQTVDLGFGETPAPLDVTLRGGTGEKPVTLDAVATEIPRNVSLEIAPILGTTLTYKADAPTADVRLDVIAPDASVHDLQIADIPTDAKVCFGGRLNCGQKASDQIVVDGDEIYTLPNSFNLDTNANGDLRIVRGKVCLPLTDQRGRRLPPPRDAPYRPCAPDDKNFIDLVEVRMRKVHLEIGGGETVEQDGDGDAMEAGLFKLWLETDDNGIRANQVKVVNTTTKSVTELDTNGGRLRNVPSNSHFYAVIDGDPPPTIEDDANRTGHLTCDDGDIEIELDVRIFGLDFDVFDLPDILDICD